MAQTDESESEKSTSEFDVGVSKAKLRKKGDFDGLLGQLPRNASLLLNDILSELRDCVLRKHSLAETRRLLKERAPRSGYRNVTPVADDVALALDLLISIASAARCEGDHFAKLIFGPEVLMLRPAAQRDAERKEAMRKAGRVTGAQKHEEAVARYVQWCQEADNLVANGKNPRDLAEILAQRHSTSASTIRRGLKKARKS